MVSETIFDAKIKKLLLIQTKPKNNNNNKIRAADRRETRWENKTQRERKRDGEGKTERVV